MKYLTHVLLLVALSSTWVLADSRPKCGSGCQAAHFFSAPRRACVCIRCRISQARYLWGLSPQEFSGEMPIHTPYEAIHLFYYSRPYQLYQDPPAFSVRDDTFQRILEKEYETVESDAVGEGIAANWLEFARLPVETGK